MAVSTLFPEMFYGGFSKSIRSMWFQQNMGTFRESSQYIYIHLREIEMLHFFGGEHTG